MHSFGSLPEQAQCWLLIAHQESSRLVLLEELWFIRKHLQFCIGRRSSSVDYSLWPFSTQHFLYSSSKRHIPHGFNVVSCVLVRSLITFENATLKTSSNSVDLLDAQTHPLASPTTVLHVKSDTQPFLNSLVTHSHTDQMCTAYKLYNITVAVCNRNMRPTVPGCNRFSGHWVWYSIKPADNMITIFEEICNYTVLVAYFKGI